MMLRIVLSQGRYGQIKVTENFISKMKLLKKRTEDSNPKSLAEIYFQLEALDDFFEELKTLKTIADKFPNRISY
jgi:hypothetical protein